jgi:hypothetical protein
VKNDLKIRAFWDVAPCSLVGVDRRFRGSHCLHHQDDESIVTMEAVRTSETSLYSNETTRRYIPEGSNFHISRRENPKSHEWLVRDVEGSGRDII